MRLLFEVYISKIIERVENAPFSGEGGACTHLTYELQQLDAELFDL